MGNHYHKKNLAYLFIISGSVKVFVKDILDKKVRVRQFKLKSGEGVILEPYETHAWKFLENSTFLLIKSKKFNEKNKDIHEAKII